MSTESRERGFMLVAALLLLSLTFLLGALLLGLGSLEMLHSAADCWGREALYGAEAGIEYARVRTLVDWVQSKSWRDGMIDGLEAPVSEEVWQELVGWTTLRECRYRVLYRHPPGDDVQVALRGEGTAGHERGLRSVETLIRPVGGPGVLTLRCHAAGPLTVQGTCWVWGEDSPECAIRLGQGGMRNYYADVPAPLAQHLPACPMAGYNGELVKSLSASLWVGDGAVLSDGGSLGEPDVAGNDTQEMLHGVFVAGALPAECFAVAEGTPPAPWPTYPSLDAPFPCEEPWSCYRDFYRRGGEAPVWPSDLRLVPPLRDGAFGGEWGDSLVWRTAGNHIMLYVHGNIEVAGNLYLGSTGHDVRYVGTGHIHSGGGAYIGGDVLPTGLLGVDDLLGISADGDVSVSCQGNCRQLGLFVHAEGTFIAEGELHFAGCLTASEAVTPEGAAFYEVPALSSIVCCSPDRWFVSSGNTRREAYWTAE